MAHGRRKGIVRGVDCPTGKGMCFTKWEVAEGERERLGAERVYKCNACGYLHVTRYTQAEYETRMASIGCTSDSNRGTMVSSNYGGSDEGDQREPEEGAGGPGATPLGRRGSSRLAPSPATLAARLSTRSRA